MSCCGSWSLPVARMTDLRLITASATSSSGISSVSVHDSPLGLRSNLVRIARPEDLRLGATWIVRLIARTAAAAAPPEVNLM